MPDSYETVLLPWAHCWKWKSANNANFPTPTPTIKKKVREFLGLTGYYRKFIASYAEHAAPLTSLTRKNGPNHVIRTSDCIKTLKEKLCSHFNKSRSHEGVYPTD